MAPEAPFWKERYVEVKRRLAETKAALAGTRDALSASRAREQEIRGSLTKVRERLQWHEHSLLRPEVPAALMTARAAWQRSATPDAAAVAREATHVEASPPYAAARDATPPDGAECVEIGGVVWWVPADARVPGRLAHRVLVDKHLPFVDILRTREAISNGIMLDIGANIGLTSVTRALLGDVDIVYAAEPAPDNFACLTRTAIGAGLRGIVLPDCVAIGNRGGGIGLQRSESIGGHAVVEHGGSIEVRMSTLDRWVEGLGIDVERVRYVKIDTQGYEAHVLEGAPVMLLRRGVVWELEFSPRHLERSGRSALELIERLQASFTHVIDLNPYAPGQRVRPIAELGEAVAYLDRSFTNLLVYQA